MLMLELSGGRKAGQAGRVLGLVPECFPSLAASVLSLSLQEPWRVTCTLSSQMLPCAAAAVVYSPNSPWFEQSSPLWRCWPCLAAGVCCCPSPGWDGAGFWGPFALAAHPGLLWMGFPGAGCSLLFPSLTRWHNAGAPQGLPGSSPWVWHSLWSPFHQSSASPRGFSPREFPSLPQLRAEHPLHGFCSPWAGWALPAASLALMGATQTLKFRGHSSGKPSLVTAESLKAPAPVKWEISAGLGSSCRSLSSVGAGASLWPDFGEAAQGRWMHLFCTQRGPGHSVTWHNVPIVNGKASSSSGLSMPGWLQAVFPLPSGLMVGHCLLIPFPP